MGIFRWARPHSFKKHHQFVAFTDVYPHTKVGLVFQCVKLISGFQHKLFVKKLHIYLFTTKCLGMGAIKKFILFSEGKLGPFSHDLLLFLLRKTLEIIFIVFDLQKIRIIIGKNCDTKGTWKLIGLFSQSTHAYVFLCYSSTFHAVVMLEGAILTPLPFLKCLTYVKKPKKKRVKTTCFLFWFYKASVFVRFYIVVEL